MMHIDSFAGRSVAHAAEADVLGLHVGCGVVTRGADEEVADVLMTKTTAAAADHLVLVAVVVALVVRTLVGFVPVVDPLPGNARKIVDAVGRGIVFVCADLCFV